MTVLGREAALQNRSQALEAPSRISGQSRNWPESRSSEAGALLQTMMSKSQGDLAMDIPRWVKIWTERSGRQQPSEYAARAEYFETLAGQNDLNAAQQSEIFRRLFPGEARDGLYTALEGAVTRFLSATQPWFPLWHAYIAWTLQWCQNRGYSHITFLCRDAVPFYVISTQSRPRVLRGERPLSISLLHASRTLISAPNFNRHVVRAIPKGQDVAVVDSGCYGSLIPQLLETLRSRQYRDRSPAVFFYFSRNPQIFGYVNYLAAWESLHGLHEPGDLTSLSDFIIRAGDIVEALPKPYAIDGIRDDGTPRLRLQDLVSFVLGAALISSLRAHVHARCQSGHHRDDALRTLQVLWKACRQEKNGKPAFCTLFSSTAPKSPPSSDSYRHLWGLPPQENLFGISSG